AAGKPDFMNWVYPDIASTKPLNIVYDMAITADGKTFGSSVTLQDFLIAGSSMQLSSSDQGGMAFGLAQKLRIANVLMQPNGRGNTGGQLSMSGVSIGAESGPGPWVIADLVNQPGQFNIVSDPSGDRLQFGIDFPKVGDAATGKMNIENITFNTPTGPLNLGSSSIGSMQLQHFNIKFRSQ
ncbi:MAG: hypothetical protein KBE07_15580, partial [Rhodoferax sp.]|nr:hypothetical protein [Rhodoferax sp.]